MPSLASLAHVARRGENVTPVGIELSPSGEHDSVETRSWLAYTAMMEQGYDKIIDGDHTLVTTNLKGLLRTLYPFAIDWGNHSQVEAFAGPVYRYLRQTGNARVAQRNVNGKTTATRYRLNNEWRSGPSPRRTLTPTTTERRLTAHEAGEDRSAAPVVVSRRPATRTKHPLVPGESKRDRILRIDRERKAKERLQARTCSSCGLETANRPALRRHRAEVHPTGESEAPRPVSTERATSVSHEKVMEALRLLTDYVGQGPQLEAQQRIAELESLVAKQRRQIAALLDVE